MCGIAGRVGTGPAPIDRAVVVRMTRALAHRGPDGEGFHFTPRCGLGHRRLAIIDLVTGAQPLANEDGTLWLSANGEVYNYVELRRELLARGHRFRTAGDLEVILHLYEERGESCVDPLVGMFAFALWDEPRQRLLLGRDRLGVKPLYYATLPDGGLAFASELKALLLDPALERALDWSALREYFVHLALPEPDTAFRAVRKLPAGHVLTWADGRVAERRYWDLTRVDPARPSDAPEAALIEGLAEELAASVAATLRSDVPVGLFLSGGLDSSLLACLASADRVDPLPTFSVAFEEREFDEGPYSRRVAEAFGTRHEEIVVTLKDAADTYQWLAPRLDEPFADASCIPTYLLARHARGRVKSVLSGEGADELFGGNPWHVSDDESSIARILAPPAKVVFTESELDAVLSADLRHAMADRPREATADATGAFARCAPGLSRRLWADLHVYLPSDLLTKADRAPMLASLEVRVPFLNHPLVERAWRLPDTLRVRAGIRKYALRRVGEGRLPREVLARSKKGFSIPLDVWLWQPGPFRDMVRDVLLDPQTRARGQFAPGAVTRMWDEHDRLRALHGYRLWTLFVFELWQRHFVDAARTAA